MVVVNACQCTLESDFSSNMHFIRIGVLSLIESAGPSHTHTAYMNCYHLFGVSLGARLLLLVPGDSGLDK